STNLTAICLKPHAINVQRLARLALKIASCNLRECSVKRIPPSRDANGCMAVKVALGLIGGLGVPAGIHYYESIARASQDDSTVRVFLAHADLEKTRNFVVAGDADGLSGYLAGILTSLSRAGATIGAIAAVTPHLCLEQLRSASPIP